MQTSNRQTKERSTMGEILKNWIQARLGAMIDLSPDVFGHYTRDGTLLAQILHSYDIINRDQLETIAHTQDPALCRVNLKHLKFWLRFLGIDCDDDSIAEISCGKGATSLRLFYKLYLCLEGKDRLHFITLQKEREKFVPTSKKFEVTTVSEDPPPYEPPDHPLCAKLCDGIAETRRLEIPSVLRTLRRKREKLEEPWKSYSIVRPVLEQCDLETRRSSDEIWKMQTEELDRFARSRRLRAKRFETYEEEERALEEEKNRFATELEKLMDDGEDPRTGQAYVERLKDRAKRAATVTALESRTRKAFLLELLERMEEKQDRTYDEVIAKRSLDQSRYEKQMVSKLCEVRDQKNAMAENRRIVENMTLKASELEHRASAELEKDIASKKQKDAEIECERLYELRRRLVEEKIRKIQTNHYMMCRRVVQDLMSVVLNVGEYRRVNDGNVSQSLFDEWKTLFVEHQPIVDETFEKLEISEEDRDSEYREWCASLERAEVHREILLEDYLQANPPWKEFSLMLGEEEDEMYELGRAVLGYAVHRLLNALYPRPPNRAQHLLSKLKSAAILLGVADSEVHRSIRALLESNGIRLVRIEDAINYCLGRYKDEMSDVEYIDSRVIAATGEATRKFREYLSDRLSPISKAKSESSSRTRTDEKDWGTRQDKETQTPREIPYDDLDPVLTDAAYIGKWVYEFLALGEPISDQLLTKVLVEYLKSVTDTKRWALIDYPNTYEQMSLLEAALTGVAPPPDPKQLDFRDVTIEEIESVPQRIVFEDQEDPFASKRRSKLVPDPVVNRDTANVARSTFVDLFVRVAAKPKNFRADASYESVSKSAPSIDWFYASRKRTNAYALYYSSLDSDALKRLARLVIGEPLQGKPSEELFGDALKELKADTGQRTVGGSRMAVIRRLLPETDSLDALEADFDNERLSMDYSRPDWTIEPSEARPGDPNWQWVDFPLASDLLKSLANLWEKMEIAYTESAKEMLYLKSVRVARIVPYRDIVGRNMKDFVRRPDNKQDLLYEFHRAFNAIDPDARHDADVKCELHRRVADFQATLWDICDERKREAEAERRRLIDDGWTVLEATILHNIFVGFVQAELDRFVDTMRIVEDYYLGMLKKPLAESTGPRHVLNRLEADPNEPLRFEERPAPEGSRENLERTERTERTERKSERSGRKTTTTIEAPPPPAVDHELLRRQIDEALIDQKNRFTEAEDCLAFRGILENARYARSVVDALSATANELIRRERLAASRLGKHTLTDSDDSIVARTATRGEDLFSEWKYAIAFETNRVLSMLDSVLGVARMDLFFLLDTAQRTFGDIYDAIVDRYQREADSVAEMGTVFRFAIEEGRIIVNEMLLEDGEFVVRSNVFVTEVVPAKRQSVAAREPVSSWRFRVIDLARLTEIFQRVAPYGTMSERAFVYVLQDLVSHGREEGESMLLPCSWYQLRGSQVSEMVRCLFGDVDHVDWRQLIVYAMELPWPSHQDLLIARERFRAQDPESRETVTRAQYHRTPLWFLDRALTDTEHHHDLLQDDFQWTVEHPDEEEPYRSSRDDGDSMISRLGKSSVFDSKSPTTFEDERFRRTLAKELLCRMYAVDRRTFNYTALLLVFCKDDDPREGFGKAVTLALGSRVCTNTDEGERYVQEIYERKRLGLSWQTISRGEALEVTRRIIERLIDRATASLSENESDESAKDSRESIASTYYFPNGEFEGEAIAFVESSSSFARDKESIVYWLSLDLCLTVLAATLPWHALRPEIFGNHSNLRDRLSAVYEELRDEHLNERKNVALAHRLLNHDFMKRLLNSVSNFTVKNIGDTVKKILRAGERT